jgi:hypothetical protein
MLFSGIGKGRERGFVGTGSQLRSEQEGALELCGGEVSRQEKEE